MDAGLFQAALFGWVLVLSLIAPLVNAGVLLMWHRRRREGDASPRS
jgi:hypothetical protein